MVALEYKLKGNEFKLLQFLKTLDDVMPYREIAHHVNISQRQITSLLKTLKEYNMIRVEKVKVQKYKGASTNKYIVNDSSEWTMNVYLTKTFKRDLERLVKAEEELNGNEQRT